MPELRWRRPTLSATERRAALGSLSPAERERHDRAPSDAFLAGRLLLRGLVAELTGTDAATLVAVCPDCGGEHGKPVVLGSKLHVSLSHCPDAVVAAAFWGSPVGVDIESPSDAAIAAIGALTGEASLLRWTRVEAILKADGRGLRVDPADVVIEGSVGRLGATSYSLTEVELAPGLVASVAVAL